MSRSIAVTAVDEVLTVARIPAGQLGGAGVDVIDHDRFALAVRRTGSALLRRVFDDSERSGGDELTRLGRLFGIKESVIKIAGGLPAGAGYRSIVVGAAGDDGVRTIELRDSLVPWAGREQVNLVGGVVPAGRLVPAGDPHLDLCWAAAIRRDTEAGQGW